MADIQTLDKTSANGTSAANGGTKQRRKRQYKPLKADPFGKGSKGHNAQYISALTPIRWDDLGIAEKFSRNESGKYVYIKVHRGRAFSLDNPADVLEFGENDGRNLMVYPVASFNTTLQ